MLSEAARDFIDIEAAFLRRAGFDVLVASDGGHLLEMVEKESPALCVLDLEMTGVPGDEAIRRIREAKGRRAAPAFILVSAGGVDAYERCLKSGAEEIFTDPFKKEDLLRKAAALLRIPRRVHARVLVRFEVEGEQMARVPFFGSSVNVSRGGILLETLEKLELGRELRIGFFLPGYSARIGCRGSIVRHEPADGGFTRYGVAFGELKESDSNAIESFVRRRD